MQVTFHLRVRVSVSYRKHVPSGIQTGDETAWVAFSATETVQSTKRQPSFAAHSLLIIYSPHGPVHSPVQSPGWLLLTQRCRLLALSGHPVPLTRPVYSSSSPKVHSWWLSPGDPLLLGPTYPSPSWIHQPPHQDPVWKVRDSVSSTNCIVLLLIYTTLLSVGIAFELNSSIKCFMILVY